MKVLLISLAIGLVTSDKLDRTYLPPPGAKSSGGDLGTHDAPLEPPNHSFSGQGPVLGGKGAQSNFGINGKPVNFGDKILKVPVTTTSYAFSQTTTYPPGENFETTAFPINPVTGLPIGLEEGNFSFGSIPGQAPNSGTNIQSGLVPQGPTSVPVSNGSPAYDQYANQPLSQYPEQNVITRVGAPQVAESVYPGQNLDQLQYTSAGEVSSEQQVFQPTGASDNRRLDQYLGQNIVIPGGVAQFPGDQRLVQYSDSQKVTGQQGFVPSTGSPINLQPAGNEQGVSYDGSQGTYTGQPINVQLLSGTEPTQPSYQNQNYNIGRIPSQYQNGNQNYGTSVPTGSVNVYQPGTTTSTVPSSYDNDVSSTTPFPALPSTTSAYSSFRPVYRPERPQAAADRSAVILNYESIRTPNGYSYSYDTSNGIHADESGIVDNGTKAQGSYSYIGDDGKLYSIIYTADENGFLPRGDHLPTPPPIPEAIQKIIEQAARDEAAGIVHDGSYDEAKYGDHLYQTNKHHRRPQIQDTNQFSNEKYNGANYDLIKSNVGTKDGDNKITGTRKDLNGIILSTTPINQKISESYVEDVSEGNEKVSEDFDSSKEDFIENTIPIIEKGLNHLNNYGTKKQRPGGRRPELNEHNLPYDEAKDSNQNNQPELESRGPSMRRPTSSNKNGITETKYPGTNVNIGAADHYKGGSINNENQDNFGSPNVFNGSENTNTNFDKVTGSPIIEDKQQILKQTVSDNKTPSSAGNKYNQNKNGRPQSESFTDKSAKTPSFLDYVKNPIVSQQETKQDDTRYQYQQPNTNFKQNKFPTRFGPQEVSSTQPVQPRNEYLEGTTRKPFITPNIYNQNNKNKETIFNKYHQNDKKGQSTTRRPFTTIGVTSPTDNSNTDYDDDGNDYATNQDISGDRISSTKKPTTYYVTSRTYQPTKTTSRTQNIPSSQRNRVIQKGSVTPGRRIETSGTITPGYTYGPTTQIASQNSRFGNNEFPRRMKPQERKPSNTNHDSVPAVGRPITTQPPSGTRHLDYKYQTTGPNSRYPGANSGSSYPTTVSYSGLSTMSTTPRVSSPQDYHTGTYGPSQGYSSMTTIPPTSGYTHGSGSQDPFRTPESLQSSQDQSFYTGYHYGPPKSGSLNTGVFPTSLTGTYQTTYQQGPSSFPSTTLGPIMPGSQGTYSTPHPGTFATMTSPTGTYQENYQNKPSTPVYATTILLRQKPEFTYSGSPGLQDTAGFKYGSSRPTFSTTDSPSTLTTTPGSFISAGTTGPFQDYSSTHPDLQITQDKFMGGPVDGFGRLIMIDQGGLKPGFQDLNQGTTGPEIGPNKSVTGHDQSTSYPGRFDETKIIGEDFSGPKQPQRYDPVTGYHYK